MKSQPRHPLCYKLCEDYCQYAVERVKEIGFEHVYTSMKSEACYYRHAMKPGCLLRIAQHAFGRTEKTKIISMVNTHGETVANIIFSPDNCKAEGMSWEAIEARIFNAVGRFFLYRKEKVTRRGYGV